MFQMSVEIIFCVKILANRRKTKRGTKTRRLTNERTNVFSFRFSFQLRKTMASSREQQLMDKIRQLLPDSKKKYTWIDIEKVKYR